jgi:hypothetical protein
MLTFLSSLVVEKRPFGIEKWLSERCLAPSGRSEIGKHEMIDFCACPTRLRISERTKAELDRVGNEKNHWGGPSAFSGTTRLSASVMLTA